MKDRALALLAAISISGPGHVWADTCSATDTIHFTPLTDFAPGQLYLNRYPGLLYDGSNSVPSDHDADGKVFASKIQPLDTNGQPSSMGKIVFLSIGFSNNTIEVCGGDTFLGPPGDTDDPEATDCPPPNAQTPFNQPESFIGHAFNDPRVNHATVVIVDGAKADQTFNLWDPTLSGYSEYDRVRDEILVPAGLSEAQVQSIWVKDANRDPVLSLPDPNAEAITAERELGNIMRAIKIRYPNIQQVFVSSRIYGGYGNAIQNSLNPEPYAYEYGFSVKWLTQAQILQLRPGGHIDSVAGDLSYGKAPWIAWGPYLWASGSEPRSDNLVWLASDFRANECTHVSTYGEQKVGTMLLEFMKTSPYTTWFLNGQEGNFSTRTFVQTGDNVMIGGFIITGSGQKRLILRAIGPSLVNHGITNPLQNPTLELHDRTGAVIASNDDWMDAPNKQEIIDSGLAPTNDLESAILTSLNPGNYTAIVRGVNNGTGIALVEGYDLDLAAGSELGNISTRSLVQTLDNVMIGGFIITGSGQEVIVRAIGPSLVQQGVTNPLLDPTLELHDGNGALIAFDDNWRDSQEAEIEATGLAPSDDRESAIVSTLAPGDYTAIVRGKNDTIGVALVEVYGLN